MVSPHLKWLLKVSALNQLIFFQGPEEILDIILGKVPADTEFSNDLLNNLWLCRPAFDKFENARAYKIEVEHLTLPNIQHYGSILPMGAADAFWNSVHRETSLLVGRRAVY
jgi:hypothetical protein